MSSCRVATWRPCREDVAREASCLRSLEGGDTKECRDTKKTCRTCRDMASVSPVSENDTPATWTTKQLDWTPNADARKINLPHDRRSVFRSEKTSKKPSARRIILSNAYFDLLIFSPSFFKNGQKRGLNQNRHRTGEISSPRAFYWFLRIEKRSDGREAN